MRGLHTQHDKKTKTYLQDQKQHTAASHKHRYMMQWLLKGFFLISVVLWHILRWRFLLVYLHPCLLFPSFRQNLLLWPPIWLDCGHVCVHVPACVCFLRSLIPYATTSCFVPVHFPCQSTPSCYGGDQRECVTVSTGTPDELWPSCLSVYFLCLSGSESVWKKEWQLGVDQKKNFDRNWHCWYLDSM